MASITFDHVTKRYDNGFVAVEDLNLTVADREFLVLVGPSGCGKTTSLRLLAGLETLSQGNLYIDDRCVNTLPAKDRNIAMVFQSYALYPHMTVFENMAFGLSLQGVPKSTIAQQVRQAAQQLDIEPLLDRKPKELSGGQRQRVAVGRAIVRHPAVFLMDEPLSNLDAKLRVQARAELSKLHRQLGTTFVYVTHDQVEAMTMGTRIAVLNQGILQQVASPQVLYDRPHNVFVAGFMGSPAMNFLPARLRLEAGELRVVTASLNLPLDPDLADRAAGYGDREVILGLRPESLYDPAHQPGNLALVPLKAEVTVVEHMGNEAILYLTLADGQEVVARVSPRSQFTVGETVTLGVDSQRVYLFDQTTELAI
ncbi:ABC transporter ATP-binding protein [Prochlorothrix hollandica]|uniref:Glycerol-3-phosphate ABC transporter ATP-binding protein n=1 Tax=Prochlorothrix hollandica PCC 9006 = CALU 1027 TaxID=317619 RepID=A0A0M2PTY7_PROHO|nr:sn-glycerol-3-phosphate ABC transporter ATP-binding protein UgpC [Prochlorothrix hollandica]KKI98138.1 glycerol-3-phosphate ABC transporter ATP-binding protein [Prochlorothrix hollandica PCC 9006 = CALU 1027]